MDLVFFARGTDYTRAAVTAQPTMFVRHMMEARL